MTKIIDLQKESWSSLEELFGELTTSIKTSLKSRKVLPKELVSCLEGCDHDDKVLKEGDTKMFVQVKDQCLEYSNIADVWSTLSRYFTFYSYKIIKIIVNSDCIKENDVKEKFKEYEKHFTAYSKEVANKYASNFDFSNSDGVTKIIIKIIEKFRVINNEHLEEFRKKLAIAIGAPPKLLKLIDLQPGCTVLTYHAPLVVEVAAFPLSALQEAALIELGVIWLRCGNYRFPSGVSVHI